MPRADEVWGDEPSEVEAEETVEEIFEEYPEVARRWHDHPAFVPFKAVARFIGRNGKRIAVTVAGFAILLAGVALLVLPGPGWLLIFIGLGILSTEYVWAERLLKKAKERVTAAKDAVLRKGSNDKGPEAPVEEPPKVVTAPDAGALPTGPEHEVSATEGSEAQEPETELPRSAQG